MRYRLIPYLLAAAHDSVQSGLPMMRHLALEFPEEPNVDTIDDQYLLGPDLLIAPVLTDGVRSRSVYVPNGTWRMLEQPHTAYTGPRFYHLRAPLARTPVLVRPAAVIPRYRTAPQRLNGALPQELILDIYPGDGSRTLTLDSGAHSCQIHYTAKNGRARLNISPAPLVFELRFPGTRLASRRLDASRGISLSLHLTQNHP